MKNRELNKLTNPIFIIAVVVLLSNDFFLKQTYGNVITGKLSDFAGLLAFPFFFSCVFPKWKKTIHIFTFLLFIWWKSTLAQPVIDWVNDLGILVGRVVDFSDNIALICILFSYLLFTRNIGSKELKPVFIWMIVFVSSFSFIATTSPPE